MANGLIEPTDNGIVNGALNAFFNPYTMYDVSDKGFSKLFGPKHGDLTGVQSAMGRAFGTQDALGAERAGFDGNYNPGMDDRLAGRQLMNIMNLEKMAAGQVPSPAELQLREQAARNAQGAYGQAAALQGRNPGAALRAALDASFKTNADANIQAAIRRSADQQQAQTALVQALNSARGQGQNLLQSDTDWRKALLGGELGALDAGTKAAAAEADASAKDAAASNEYKGKMFSGGAGILAAL